jgi:hypothetical protein
MEYDQLKFIVFVPKILHLDFYISFDTSKGEVDLIY